jgi:hypothetical protein
VYAPFNTVKSKAVVFLLNFYTVEALSTVTHIPDKLRLPILSQTSLDFSSYQLQLVRGENWSITHTSAIPHPHKLQNYSTDLNAPSQVHIASPLSAKATQVLKTRNLWVETFAYVRICRSSGTGTIQLGLNFSRERVNGEQWHMVDVHTKLTRTWYVLKNISERSTEK